jgi:ATP-dependent DNA helicase RecG
MADEDTPSFSLLPLDVRDLLQARGVESTRIEFKATWDDKTTADQVVRTLCAFANDLYNVNGGYLVLGVASVEGVAALPPSGLPPDRLESIAKKIRGRCNQIDPHYLPVFSHEIVDGRHLLVLWAPASDHRPHQAPEGAAHPERHFWVRVHGETCRPTAELRQQLLERTARVPFDDRRSLTATLDDLRESRARSFLRDVRSGLADLADPRDIYRSLRVSYRVNGHEVPRNAGLLFFTDDPEAHFRGARIEVVQFAASGDIFEEHIFRGPLHEQVRDCLAYLGNLSTHHLEKQPDQVQRRDWVSFPLAALREAVVNAVYHRSYDGEAEPTKVYLFPDRIEITSYPGPAPGLEARHFAPEVRPPEIPARNRRIGEFFKELRLAEARNTGLLKIHRAMLQNGSPQPRFLFDTARTYFTVVLPAHPEYIAIAALREAAHLRAVGDHAGSLALIDAAFRANPGSGTIAAALLDEYRLREHALEYVENVAESFFRQGSRDHEARVLFALASAYMDANQRDKANATLKRMSPQLSARDACEAAILARRAGDETHAHKLFTRAGDLVERDARALHEFAQCKLWLAKQQRRHGDRFQRDAALQLLREARQMLQRVTQMDAPAIRRAWAYYNLGQVLQQLGAPVGELRSAREEAARLAPDDGKLQEALRRLPPIA